MLDPNVQFSVDVAHAFTQALIDAPEIIGQIAWSKSEIEANAQARSFCIESFNANIAKVSFDKHPNQHFRPISQKNKNDLLLVCAFREAQAIKSLHLDEPKERILAEMLSPTGAGMGFITHLQPALVAKNNLFG